MINHWLGHYLHVNPGTQLTALILRDHLVGWMDSDGIKRLLLLSWGLPKPLDRVFGESNPAIEILNKMLPWQCCCILVQLLNVSGRSDDIDALPANGDCKRFVRVAKILPCEDKPSMTRGSFFYATSYRPFCKTLEEFRKNPIAWPMNNDVILIDSSRKTWLQDLRSERT